MALIILTNGMTTLVDDDLFEELNQFRWTFKARPSGSGYAIRSYKDDDGVRRTEYMHRRVAQTPVGLLTDHANGDTLDNRIENLRHVTTKQNGMNRKANQSSTSRFIGVSFVERYQKFIAQIKADGRIINLGYYADEEKAARARDAATRVYFGQYGRLNFPNDDGQGPDSATIP
jgi:hypothetical protein